MNKRQFDKWLIKQGFNKSKDLYGHSRYLYVSKNELIDIFRFKHESYNMDFWVIVDNETEYSISVKKINKRILNEFCKQHNINLYGKNK